MNGKFTVFWRTLTVLSLLPLSGCLTALGPVDSTTGRAPASLRQPCPELPPLQAKALLGDVVEQMAADASQYRECAARVKGWIDWEEGVLGKRKGD